MSLTHPLSRCNCVVAYLALQTSSITAKQFMLTTSLQMAGLEMPMPMSTCSGSLSSGNA